MERFAVKWNKSALFGNMKTLTLWYREFTKDHLNSVQLNG